MTTPRDKYLQFLKAQKDTGSHTWNEETPEVRTTIHGRCANETGTRRIFENRWVDMCRFFIEIGDFQSALICDRKNCPDSPHPIEPMSLNVYVTFNFEEKGQLLTYRKKAISNVNGEDIICRGNWIAPKNIEIFEASVNRLHMLYPNLRGQYCEPCSECVSFCNNDNVRSGIFRACTYHAGAP